MADFQTALAITLRQEVGDDPDGAYSDDKNDRGGPTKWGISQAQYPDLDIRNLTKEQATHIYLRDFWNANKYGLLNDQAVANKMFDMSVNEGQPTANGFLQEAVGVAVDRIIGPITIAAANAANPQELVEQIRQLQIARYEEIVAKNPQDAGFLEDWLRRANAV